MNYNIELLPAIFHSKDAAIDDSEAHIILTYEAILTIFCHLIIHHLILLVLILIHFDKSNINTGSKLQYSATHSVIWGLLLSSVKC